MGKNMKTLLTIILATMLAACGGGESAEEKTLEAQHIVLAGDSTAHQYPVGLLQSKLPAGSVVENKGVPGLCTLYGKPLTYVIINDAPANATIFYFSGINDARKCGTSTAKFIEIVDNFVQTAKAQGKRFVPVTPNPTFGQENIRLEAFAVDERAHFEVFDLRLMLQTTATPFDYAYEVRKDGTHMTPKIYDWMAGKMVEFLVK
jgi:hypothetical protein